MKFQSKWTLMRSLAGLLTAGLLSFLIPSCTPFSSDDPNPVLDLQFDAQNDSILTCDTLIVKVYSKDSSFVQEVFHGKPDDARKLKGIQLDPRVGKQFQVSITGYKADKVTVSKEITVLGPKLSESKNLPIKDTTPINGTQPTLQFTADTSITEGEGLHVKVAVLNPWTVSPAFGLVGAPAGASIDSTGLLTWKPDSTQGRAERYTFTITYSSEGKKVEKGISILVRNLNRPPRITPIPDKKGNANELITFKVEATDPDMDSIQLTATSLPSGASFVNGTFSWTPTESQTGNYSARFKAFDGNDSDIASALLTIGNVDVPPPLTLDIISPSKDTTVNTPSLQITYLVNSTAVKRSVALKDGRTRVYIDTTVLGRTAFDTVWVTLDTVPPSKPRVSGATPISSSAPNWHWGTGGGGNGSYRYRLDVDDMSSATVVKDTSVTWPKDLDPGTHTLFVQERDDAGNWSPSGKWAIRIDTTKPAAPVISLQQASPTNVVLPTWTWTATGGDLSGNSRYRLDNPDMSAGTTVTTNPTFTPAKGAELKEGNHILYVQVQDSAGNWSTPGSATIRIDLTPPTAPVLTLGQTSPTNNPKPSWTWKSGGGGNGDYRFKLDDSSLAVNAVVSKAIAYSPDSALKAGKHSLYIQERDSAGNWSSTSSLSLIIDLTPPNRPLVSGFVYQTSDPTPTWHWTSGGGGGSGSYRYKIDDSTMSTGTTATTDTSASPTSALTAGAGHTLFVQERDSAGNWSPIGSFLIRVHGQTGFAYATAGKILRTTNGGTKWDTITYSGGQDVYDMHFPTPQVGFGVGYQGTVIKTTNGGASWTSIATGLDNFLFTTWFTSATTGFAAGEYGKIFKTTSGGSSWQELPSKTTDFIYGIQFIDANTGYVAGEGGIFWTTNAGATWDTVAMGSTDTYYSVHFVDPNTGWAGGGSGAIYATKDGGKTWKKTATGATAALDEIVFTDPNHGFATVYQTFVNTTDGGKTWNGYSGPLGDLYNATFIDNNTGIARTTSGDVAQGTGTYLSWSVVAPGAVNGSWKFYFP
jgi:photosystem II stability/assembly factor-like uncharacterized protein